MNRRLHLLVTGIYVTLSIIILGAASTFAAPTRNDYVEGEILIKVRDGFQLSKQAVASTPYQAATFQPASGDTSSLNTLLSSVEAVQAEPLLPQGTTYQVSFHKHMDAARLAAMLTAHPAVVFAEPNYTYHMQRTPNDPFVREQWALTNIQAFEAWDITTGNGLAIAVLDTGVDRSHPDLDDKILPGYNAITQSDQANDDNGHGTAVSGLIAAKTDNGEGIAGICWNCRIMPVKVLNSRGGGNVSSVTRGIYWATDSGARVINLSLGGTDDSQALRESVTYAISQGVLVVAASGNERQQGNPVNYPAAYPEVLAVSGTGNTDAVTGFSNTGDYIDLAAPSVGLWTTIAGEREYGPPNGTSFSSPYVAGVAGLVWALRPDLSNVDVKCVLEASADDKGEPGKDPEYGWGRLNAFKAVQLAQTYNGCPLEPQAVEQPEQAPAPVEPAGAFAPAAPVSTTPTQTYFPETQHTLRNTFKSYWERHGGLPIFGYPISEEFVERGDDGNEYVVQYFQRHRFEWHPENLPPYDVQLTRIGATMLEAQDRSWYTFPKGAPSSGCLFFEATGHTLCEPFLSYWQANGLEFDGQPGKSYEESLALFGQPLSEPQAEEVAPGVTVTVQWFERARFEDHGPEGVLLGLLSSELARLRGWR